MEVDSRPIRVQYIAQSGAAPQVPPEYIQPPETRPNNPTARPANNNPIPSIDLSSAVRDVDFLRTEIGAAYREWGAFHVTNHGVPPKLLDEISPMLHTFFEACPMDEKLRYSCDTSGAATEVGTAVGEGGDDSRMVGMQNDVIQADVSKELRKHLLSFHQAKLFHLQAIFGPLLQPFIPRIPIQEIADALFSSFGHLFCSPSFYSLQYLLQSRNLCKMIFLMLAQLFSTMGGLLCLLNCFPRQLSLLGRHLPCHLKARKHLRSTDPGQKSRQRSRGSDSGKPPCLEEEFHDEDAALRPGCPASQGHHA
ncbi:hypothetical protein RJ640_016002 [Escallonia rubra]|uniref:Non-haem dioxygenase N-terminal domain-containing protein n=1 Tax=Escallonia rubra TaxID=112253 RepID=A0AA88RC19_9ASTE|nr:hypothetical protein RJ640_016002 [Escallonia rubra]